MTTTGKLLMAAGIAILCLLLFLAYREFTPLNVGAPDLHSDLNPGINSVAAVSPESAEKRPQNSVQNAGTQRDIRSQAFDSGVADANFAVAFNAATNQAQALEAINKGYAEKKPSSLYARVDLAGMCRHAILKPQSYTSDPNNTYKAQVLKYCEGYTDLLDQNAFDAIILQEVKQGIRARIMGRMQQIEKEHGTVSAFEEAITLLKTEQDPYAASLLLDYLGSTESAALPSIADNLPNGVGVAYRAQDALHVASEFIFCELAGGCGPYQFRTLQLCMGDITCPPGATVRDVYTFTASPAVIQAADVIVARWRALRQCGRYQCGS